MVHDPQAAPVGTGDEDQPMVHAAVGQDLHRQRVEQPDAERPGGGPDLQAVPGRRVVAGELLLFAHLPRGKIRLRRCPERVPLILAEGLERLRPLGEGGDEQVLQV